MLSRDSNGAGAPEENLRMLFTARERNASSCPPLQRACAALALCAATALDLSAQTFTTLHSFDRTDGERPMAALIQVTSGDLYGTTNSGGSGDGVGFGTAFAISPSGTFKTIHEFCSQTNTLDDCLDGASPTGPFLHCADGANPETALIQAPNRDFCRKADVRTARIPVRA